MMSAATLHASCIALLLFAVATVADDRFVVSVTGGDIQGAIEPNFNTYVAKGIPFAAPPVGALRFVAPQPVANWTGVRPALSFSSGCMSMCPVNRQNNCAESVSEDCLYLNVYTPNITVSKPLPVVLWLHGGLFVTCSAASPAFDGSRFAKEQNVVVVTTNYRLAAFGGLYTNRSVFGNLNLMDQRSAMAWVQNNIHTFGGDATRVQIAGESAGAMSVACHLSSPQSWPFFTSAVMSSNPWQHGYATPAEASLTAQFLMSKLGCSNASFTAAEELACLQQAPAAAITGLGMEALEFGGPFAWAPVVDGSASLPVQPLDAAISGWTRPNTTVLSGSNSNDTMHMVFNLYAQRNLSHTNVTVSMGVLASWFGDNQTILSDIVSLYGSPASYADQRLYLAPIYTDFNMFCAARFTMRHLQQHFPSVPTYHFRFDVVPSFDRYWWNGTTFLSDWGYCVGYSCHSDDVPYDFNSFYAFDDPVSFPYSLTPDEVAVSRLIQSTWADIAGSGNVTWGGSVATNSTLVFRTSPSSAPVSNLRGAYCDFFDSIGYNRGLGW